VNGDLFDFDSRSLENGTHPSNLHIDSLVFVQPKLYSFAAPTFTAKDGLGRYPL
jgi:hypothetical protein